MSRSITNPIKSFRPQRTGTRLTSSGHRGVLKSRSDSSTSSDSVNMLASLLSVPDPDWSLYEKYDYIGKTDALDICSVYTAEINKVANNPRDSRHYDTSKPCAVCGKTGHTFGECELLKKHDFLKIHCINFQYERSGWTNYKRIRVQHQTSQRGLVVPSEILRYFPCSGSLVQDRSFESLRTFGREDCKCSGPRAVENSHTAG